jgi:DNA repair protein RadC
MTQDQIIQRALKILDARMRTSEALSSPDAVRSYLRLKLARLEHEVFVCVFVDAQNHVIALDEMFRGTLTQTSVFPREIVKAALAHNAAGVFFAHNHPSGVAEPSHADELLTSSLKTALALVDCRVLDHFIVGGAGILSFAERGLI